MRSFAKIMLRMLALLCVAPALSCYLIHRLVAKESAIVAWSQALANVPGTTGVYFRHAFYRFALDKCDHDAFVGFGTIFSSANASLGQTAYVGNYCSVGNVCIEKDVLIASHVSIMNGTQQHLIDRLDIPVREQIGRFPPITIGEDSWIGERATVAANVGRHCVIGAGSVVLNDIPDYAIAVGCPAKIIKDRRDLVSNSEARKTARQA